jgi:RNA polymerase sigma-70 factor (ECF subfamily)
MPRPVDGEQSDAGAAATLSAIFRTHSGQLYAVAYRYVRSRAVAEELIQDVFLAVWDRRARWGSEQDVTEYVFASVRNRCLNHLRHERIEATWQANAAGNAEEGGTSQFARDAAERQEADERTERVRQAVAELPERARRALLLRVHRQLSNAEIAEVMEISVRAVEANLQRAMSALRKALGIGPP